MEAATNIYRTCLVMVRQCARRILGSDAAAEDVAQEAFIRFFNRYPPDLELEHASSVLYRIAVNLSLNRIRDDKRRRTLLERRNEVRAYESPPPELRLLLEKVLASVKEEEARIATLYYLEGFEQEEIARHLDMTRRTVGRRLEQFRTRARKVLDSEEVSYV